MWVQGYNGGAIKKKKKSKVGIKMSIRILLADNHKIIRDGLRSLLEKEPDIEVVGEADNGRTACNLVHQLQPNVVVMDITMPLLNGVDATRLIVKDCPEAKVIALSIHSNRAFVADMLRAGASGYILKESPFDELVEAIKTVANGGKYLSPKVAGVVVSDYVKHLSKITDSSLEMLSSREREVLQLIAEGMNTKQISLEINVSTKTVEVARRKIMDKLGARSIAELVKIAITGGLASLDM